MLAASKFRGTIYISEVETEAARANRVTRSERQEEMMYWGYKFEQYTCAGLSPSGVIRLLIVKGLAADRPLCCLLRWRGRHSRPGGRREHQRGVLYGGSDPFGRP